MKDATELEKLSAYADDTAVLEKLLAVKQGKKEELASYLKQTQNIAINPDSVFDIQIKRLHEYKRQQMNALYVIDKYFEIKEGKLPKRPITVIFGARLLRLMSLQKTLSMSSSAYRRSLPMTRRYLHTCPLSW